MGGSMNIVIGCSFTISKKLEGLVEPGEPVYIHIDSVHGNKGMGHIRLAAKRVPRPDEIGNTSIMLDAISISESAPDYADTTPVSNFFSGDVETGVNQPTVERFAKVDPDKEMKSYRDQSVASRIAPRKAERQATAPELEAAEKEAPEANQEAPQPQQTSIMGYDELMAEVMSLGNIDFDIPAPANGKDRLSRTEAVKIEKQGKMAPRIKKPAFVRNVRGVHIEIADMDEKIADKEVFDLGRVPARRIRDSRDLKWCLDNGILAFCDRQEYIRWLETRDSSGDSNDHGLKAYSGPHAAEQAADNMFNDGPDPMVRQSTPRNNPSDRLAQSRRPAVIRGNDDIIDTEGDVEYEDPEDIHRKRLIESMDSGGVRRDDRRQPPSFQGRNVPGASGGAKVKNIRKV
jgi:hypothetical protein